VGKHLDQARAVFGGDTKGLLEGGSHALVHTRSLEFDDLRPYVPGDDVRDIDWKATARSGHVLIKRFVSEMHHKILVVADTGQNMAALAASWEFKRDVAAHVIGAMGLITLGRSDEIGMVFGDVRGCVDIRLRRGETHLEYMLHRFHQQTTNRPAASDIAVQLDWVASHYRRRHLVLVVSDEPDLRDGLRSVLPRLTARHDVMWAMVADLPAVGSGDDQDDGRDVSSGRFVLSAAAVGVGVVDAYRRAEDQRRQRLSEFMIEHGVPHATIAGSADIRAGLNAMTGVLASAG
jgi:uncharacterized protein (DUF58 family)